MHPEVLEEIRRLIAQRRKIEAIKRWREITQVGLKEAKDAVEALERGEPRGGEGVGEGAKPREAANGRSSAPEVAGLVVDDGGDARTSQRLGMRPEVLEEVRRLIAQGRKIEAVKRWRETTQVGLKEAKDAVEALERGEPVTGLVVDDGGAASPRPSVERRGLPSRCSSCGAAIGAASVKWVTPQTAECLYCGRYLRVG